MIISGILTNGSSKPINGTIVFTAKKTTSKVIENTQVIIDVANGNYSVDLLPCDYDVVLKLENCPKNRLGSIRVLADSRNGSLNDYLLNPAESEITPDILQQVVEARDTAKKSEENAKKFAETIDTSTLVKKSGDTIYGQLIIDSDWSGLKIKNSHGNLWITRAHPDNSYSISSFDTSTNTNQFKLRYVGSLNKWRFENIEDVTINGKSALKVGDGGLFSKAPLLPSGTNLLSDDVLSVSQTFTLAGNYLNAPITGITGTLIVTRRMYDEGAGATLEINQTNNKYYKTTARKSSAGWVSGGWIEQITTANINDYLPVGVPMPWPSVTPPDGWFECNGSPFNKNQHPKLATVYPSGRLPDLRGEFIRGWDHGRGVNPNRVILSWEECAIQRHNHAQNIRSCGEAGQGNPWGSGSDDRFENDYRFVTGDTGGNETRPRNIAFMYIIKAE